MVMVSVVLRELGWGIPCQSTCTTSTGVFVGVGVRVGVLVGVSLGVGVSGTQVLIRMDTLLEKLLAAARSCLPSWLKSPTATEGGPLPTPKLVRVPKEPAPSPSRIDTLSVPSFAVVRSCLLSPLKSPTATER